MARVRPGSARALAAIPGVGEKKLAEFSNDFLSRIRSYCERHELRMDDADRPVEEAEPEIDRDAAVMMLEATFMAMVTTPPVS